MSTGGIPSRLRLEYPRLGKAEEGKQSPAYSKLFLTFHDDDDGWRIVKEEVGGQCDVCISSFTYIKKCNISQITECIDVHSCKL